MADETFDYSSCRICSIATDGDYVDLFEKNDGLCKTLTISGKLYQELIDVTVLTSEPEYYPKNICTCCDLQMKLFKEVKERALKSFQKLESYRNKQIYETIELTEAEEKQQQPKIFTIVTDETDCSGNKQDFNFHIENLSNILTDKCHNGESIEESLVQVDSDYIEDQEKTIGVEDYNSMLIVHDDFAGALEVNENVNISDMKANHEESLETSVTEMKDLGNYIRVHYFAQKSDKGELHNVTKTTRNWQGNPKENSTTGRIDPNLCKCKECSCEFPTLRLLRVHRQENHPLVYRCTECSKAMRSAEALEVHKKQHLGLPAYSCEQCNKTFKQKVHYQYHIKRHNNERNFSCKECGKKYVSKWDLTIHMRQHSGVRPYTCPIEDCGKKCYTEQHLKMHMYHHNDDKSFECDICHRKFVSPTVLHTHLKTIHVERRYECPLCGMKFRRKHHLEVHALTHEKNPLKSDNLFVLENMDNSFIDGDVMMDLNDQVETTSELNYEQFIEINGFDENPSDSCCDDEFFTETI